MMNTVTKQNRSIFADAAWAVALRLPRFGYAEIAAELKISHDRATDIVRSWGAAGVLQALEPTVNKRKTWRIAPATPRPARPQGRTAEDNLWTAMRGLVSFTPSVLAANATVEEVEVSPDAAQTYCRSLLVTGYLRVIRKAAPPHTEAIYRLVRNTGPKAPREKRLRAVVDDNTDAVHLIRGVS